jgi:hypothetical protein
MIREYAYIWDFHGTLADTSPIVYLAKERRYEEFYEASLTCAPHQHVVEAARESHDKGYINLLFTGMQEKYREGLTRWLAQHDVPIDVTRMRRTGDFRKDFVIKREMHRDASGMYVCVHATEDSPNVVDLWRELLIPVTVVPGWSH